MSETYVEFHINNDVIFRIDSQSEYGFFHNNATGDLYLCHPMLTRFVSEEIKQKTNVSLLQQMLDNLADPLDSTIPSLRHISLYVTDKCNLSCLHCWISARATGREMSVSLPQLLSVIDHAISLGLSRIGITGGEPLTWRALPKLIEAISGRGLRVHIDTNGALLDRDMAARFADLNVHVALSLDSHLKALHDHLRGVPDAFKRVCKALDLLNDFNVQYELNTCVYKENYPYVQGFFQWCCQVGVQTVKLNPIVAWGRGSEISEKGLLLSTQELLSLADLIRATSDISILPSLPPSLFPLDFNFHLERTGLCDPRRILSIQPDGHVSVCGPGYRQKCWRNIGRVGDNLDLVKLWTTHPLLLKIRREIPQSIPGICANCIFSSKFCFGFCPVLTYNVTNSWLAPFPLCQQLYETQKFPEIYRRGD